MYKKHLIIFFLSFLFLISSILFADQENVKELSIPNPLELKQDWWGYFDVPNEKLKNHLQSFKTEVTQLVSSLDDKKHEEIYQKVDQIFLLLDIYAKRREEVKPSLSPNLQLLEFYTLEQLIEVHEQLQHSLAEIGANQKKIKILQPRLNRLQSALDRSILQYQKLSPTTYEKLQQGLQIIEQRIEYAILELELQREKEVLEYHIKESDLYREELTAAKGRLIFDNQILNQLHERLEETKRKFSEAKDQLFQLEKQSLSINQLEKWGEFACCLGDNQVLYQSILVENYKINLLINDIKTSLVNLALNHRKLGSKNIQEQLSQWRQELDIAEKQIQFWDSQIIEGKAQVSRMTTQFIQKGNEGRDELEDLIGDIYFELNRSLAQMELLKIHLENGKYLARLVEDQLVEKKSFMQTWAITLKGVWYKFKEFVEHFTHVTLFRVKEQPVTLMTFINAILIFFAGIVFSYYIRKILIKRKIVLRKFSYSTEYIVLRLIHYAIIIIVLLIALSFIGLDFTNLAIVAGALGVGIGFGLQTMVSNISSGFMLLLNKYLKVGDVIELTEGQLGTVTAVNLQNTIIRTYDGAEIMMPNSQLSSQRLTNWTMKDNARRFIVPFGVAYGTDKNLVRAAIVEAIKKLPFVYTDNFRYPDPQVWLVGFGDSSVNFELVAWVDLSAPVPYETSKSALVWELETTLKENGIEIPFPQRDIHVKSFPSDS